MEIKKREMIQQDLKSVKAYVLGVISLVLALFVPFAVLILRIFSPLWAAFILGAGIPLFAVIIGIFGFARSLRQSNAHAKAAKVLSIVSIIIGLVLFVFNLYIFIKALTLNA